LDIVNNFYRYTIDLNEVVPNPSYPQQQPGGDWYPTTNFLVNAPNGHKWKLYRIPLDAGITVGNPSLTQINSARVWIDGFQDSPTDHYEVSLATLEIVGNEWEAASVNAAGDSERVSVEVINTYDNLGYTPPPGVAGYRDPLTNIVSQEQSLMLRINDLPKDSTGLVVHRMYDTQDYLEYRKLKMFAHGGGLNESANEWNFGEAGNPKGIWMFLRFGADTTNNYYEYRQRVWPGWDDRNNIEISLSDLTQLKVNRPDPLVLYGIPIGGGDSLSIMGNPSISQVRQYTVGIIPRDRDIVADSSSNMQIWLDELRVSGVKKTIGRKGRASADLALADVATLHANMDASDGNFHNINERVGSRANSISGAATGTLQVQKFLNPKWGLNIPVSGNFSQSESVPYYFTNSDVLVDKSNAAQVDSVKTHNLTYGGGIDISKPTPSSSNWLKYTIDKLSGGYDYSRHEQTDPYYQFSNSTTHGANLAYNLTFGRPGVKPFTWLGGIPYMKKYSATQIYPLITKLNLTLTGSESMTQSHLRSGTNQFTHTFVLTKTVTSGLHPFESVTFDFNRTHKADLLRNPLNPKGLTNILRGDLGWDDDNDVSQTVTGSYTPRLLSWLDTDARYNSSYHWAWTPPYNPSGQSISNTTSLSGSLTLKLTQIFKAPAPRGGTTPGTLPRPGTPGQQQQQGEQSPGGGKDEGGGQGQGQTPDQLSPLTQMLPEQQPGQPGLPPMGLSGLPGDTTRHDTTLAHTDTTRADTTPRNMLQIAKPIKRGALSDFWYAVRYTITRLRDVRLDYTQSNQWSDPLVDGQAGIGYQLGISSGSYQRISGAENYSGFPQRNRSDDYKVKSGLDFTKDFKISLSYNYRWTRNASSSVNGSVTQSQLYFFKSSGDSISVFQIPIPEWSVSWTGWEKFALFRNIAQTVSVEHAFTGQRTSTWNENPDNISKHDYTRNFSPLVGMNMTFKKGITATARLNWTETGSVQMIPSPSKTRNRQTNLAISASYSMKSGFRIPIPIWPFKNKRFKNSSTFGMAINMSSSHQEQDASGKFAETSFTSTWSVKPSLDYTFSNTVTGGAHFEYGKNKSKTGDSNFQEFGISVNITIRG
jgi:cell surface protein SprA